MSAITIEGGVARIVYDCGCTSTYWYGCELYFVSCGEKDCIIPAFVKRVTERDGMVFHLCDSIQDVSKALKAKPRVGLGKPWWRRV